MHAWCWWWYPRRRSVSSPPFPSVDATWSFVWRRCLRGRFGRFNRARTIDRRMTRHDAPRAHRLEADSFSSEFLTLTITNWRISLQFGRFLVCFSQKWKKNDFFEGKVRQIWNRVNTTIRTMKFVTNMKGEVGRKALPCLQIWLYEWLLLWDARVSMRN